MSGRRRAKTSCTVCGAPGERGRCSRHPRTKTANQQRAYRGSAAYNRVRAQVLERDHHTCWRCGGYADTIDHVIPYSRMPRATRDIMRPEDFRAACADCNRRRGAAA